MMNPVDVKKIVDENRVRREAGKSQLLAKTKQEIDAAWDDYESSNA